MHLWKIVYDVLDFLAVIFVTGCDDEWFFQSVLERDTEACSDFGKLRVLVYVCVWRGHPGQMVCHREDESSPIWFLMENSFTKKLRP